MAQYEQEIDQHKQTQYIADTAAEYDTLPEQIEFLNESEL